MALAPFVSLLDTKCLWFTCITELEDRFEGSYPVQNVQRRQALRSATENLGVPEAVMQDYISSRLKSLRAGMYVNCWYSGPHESAALWQWAARRGDSVAIRTSFGKLADSLQTDDEVYAAKIAYVDFDQGSIPDRSIHNVFFCKRQSYRHENEVRLLVDRTRPKQDRPTKGLSIQLDLEKLSPTIIVEPLAPTWLRQVVESIVRCYGLQTVVRQSALDADPVW